MARRYRYEVSEKGTSLGQIERGLGLLGFKVLYATRIDGNMDGTIRKQGEGFRVIFTPGKTMDHKLTSDAILYPVEEGEFEYVQAR